MHDRPQQGLHGRLLGKQRKPRLERLAVLRRHSPVAEVAPEVGRQRATPFWMMPRNPPGGFLQDRISRVEQRDDIVRGNTTAVHLIEGDQSCPPGPGSFGDGSRSRNRMGDLDDRIGQ